MVVCCVLAAGAQARPPIEVLSPDGQVAVRIGPQDRLEPYPAGSRLYYSVRFR